MKTNIRNTSRKLVSMFLALTMILTVLIQLPTTKANASTSLEIQMYNTNTSDSVNTINPNFKLINNGTEAINLSTVKFRYYYTKDYYDNDTNPISICDYCSVGTSYVTSTVQQMTTTTDTADTYIEIGFTAGTLSAGSSAQLQFRIYNTHWSNLTQTNDYSFNANDSSYALSNNVPVYISDELVYGSEPIDNVDPVDPIVYPTYDSNKDDFLIIVAKSLFNSLTADLNTYVQDVFADGYNSKVITVSNSASAQANYVCATAPQLKNVIKNYYNQGYKGFVLIGSYPEIPVAQWKNHLASTVVNISDYYYADVDLNNDGVADPSEDWTDADNDNVFEVSVVNNGVKSPIITESDMFYGRIDAGGKSSTAAGQAEIIHSYFEKLNAFRGNRQTISAQKKSALGFTDDDWRTKDPFGIDDNMRVAFDNVKMIQDNYATNSKTLLEEFSKDYYFMDIVTHGGSEGLYPKENPFGKLRDAFVSGKIIEKDLDSTKPSAYYIHSFGCCTSKYAEDKETGMENIENVGATYLFNKDKTVNVTGVCGSIYNNLNAKYFKNLCNESIGEAYKEWLKDWFNMDGKSYNLTDKDDSSAWECVPMYVLLGDPTLKHPLQEKTNKCSYFVLPKDSNGYTNHFNAMSLELGEDFSLTVTPDDHDNVGSYNDITSVSMSEAPAGATFDSDTNTINWTPTVEQCGGFGQKFILNIVDKAQNIYTEQFNVYVNDPNPPDNLSFDMNSTCDLPIGWETEQCWKGASTFSSDNKEKHSGDYSARISSPEVADHSRFTNSVNVDTNTDYVVTGYIKTQDLVNHENTNLNTAVGANLKVICGDDSIISTNYLAGDKDWTKVTVNFNSGENESIQILCSLGSSGNTCTGTAWFDDITVAKASEIEDTDNLSFEVTSNGLPVGWDTEQCWISASTFSVDNNKKNSGDYSAKITSTTPDHSRFIKTMPVTKNTNYIVRGYIYTENLVNNEQQTKGANLRVICGDESRFSNGYLVGTTPWTPVEVEFNSGDNDSIQIACCLGSQGNVCSGTAWFDDISIEEVQ